MAIGSASTWMGLDLNATRARAALGPAEGTPFALRLDEHGEELPLAVSLEGRTAEVGRAALRLCRRSPHLVCSGYLPFVGLQRTWAAGRQRLNALQAVQVLFDRLRPALAGVSGLTLTLPPYLNSEQVGQVAGLMRSLRLPVLGSVSAPVALALAAYGRGPWSGPAVVLDVDEHALTCSTVAARDGEVELRESRTFADLGERLWKERLLDRVADRCVRQSRRDPRQVPEVEQSLYEQLERALAGGRAESVDLVIQTPNWYQGVHLSWDDLVACCAPLVQRAVEAVQGVSAFGSPLILAEATGRLPGLAGALRQRCLPPSEPALAPVPSDEDFGESLLSPPVEASASFQVLPPEAAAQAAWDLAGRFARRELTPGHLARVSLTPQVPPEAGPPRIQFQGRDYYLSTRPFWAGRHFGCDLVVDGAQYPGVSARHCEVVLDHRQYILRDRGRHGTLLNDRPVAGQAALQPGDWICLGPRGGPVLRFLGSVSADHKRLVTTA